MAEEEKDILTEMEKVEAIMAKWAAKAAATKKKEEAAKAAAQRKEEEGALAAGAKAGRGLGIGTSKQMKGLDEEGY